MIFVSYYFTNPYFEIGIAALSLIWTEARLWLIV
jgi:hypothetical protein